MSALDDYDLGDFFEGDEPQDPFGDLEYIRSLEVEVQLIEEEI